MESDTALLPAHSTSAAGAESDFSFAVVADHYRVRTGPGRLGRRPCVQVEPRQDELAVL